MPEVCSFRQVDEKHVSAEVVSMLWSPKMDLIALSNVQGEVILYRLSWQKVWTLPSPTEDKTVSAMAWRPDGKVLAVCYNNGQMLLCDVENAAQLHTISINAPITSSAWTSQRANPPPEGSVHAEVPPSGAYVDSQLEEARRFLRDTSSHYLLKLPPFSKSYTAVSKNQGEDNMEDTKRLKGQTDLNLLLLGTEDGQLYIYAFGVFPVSVIDLSQHGLGKRGKVLSGQLSEDLMLLSVIVESKSENGENTEVFNISFDTVLLASRHKELQSLALKFGQVLALMAYLDCTIQQMVESWEDILLEMDSKLMKLAQEKYNQGGSVSNDFLHLLMFGIPSDELQHFLLNDLTEKGLKKLGHSIETSYCNIQKLVLKHLQTVGQALVYHLSEARGLAGWHDCYGVLGLSKNALHEAVQAAGTFMLKACELQQVIDSSIRNFKAFFRWLYVVIQRLSEEPVPPELTKMTQQDLNFVAQFLTENFTEEGETKQSFRLERVRQYLKDEDLPEAASNTGNPWVEFLQDNEQLRTSTELYIPQPTKSLLQLHNQLQKCVTTVLDTCASVIGQSLQCVSTVPLYIPQYKDNQFIHRVSQFSQPQDDGCFLYTLFTASNPPCEHCYLLRQHTRNDSHSKHLA